MKLRYQRTRTPFSLQMIREEVEDRHGAPQQGRMAPVRDDFATYCFAAQLPDPWHWRTPKNN